MVSKGSRVTGFDIGVESLYKTRGNSHVSCVKPVMTRPVAKSKWLWVRRTRSMCRQPERCRANLSADDSLIRNRR